MAHPRCPRKRTILWITVFDHFSYWLTQFVMEMDIKLLLFQTVMQVIYASAREYCT